MGRKWIGGHPVKRKKVCLKCEKFFARFKCNASDECDCPKCHGLCGCDVRRAVASNVQQIVGNSGGDE